MDVAFKVLEFTAEAHPSDHVNMIFKLLYASIYDIFTVTGKNTKLSWMKTNTHIPLTCKFANLCKATLQFQFNIWLLPKVSKVRLCVHGQLIAAQSHHAQAWFKSPHILNQVSSTLHVVRHDVIQTLFSNFTSLAFEPSNSCTLFCALLLDFH